MLNDDDSMSRKLERSSFRLMALKKLGQVIYPVCMTQNIIFTKKCTKLMKQISTQMVRPPSIAFYNIPELCVPNSLT